MGNPTHSAGWLLGIDFGTTETCAAVRESEQIRELQIDGSARLPSAVFLDRDGELLVGRAAESRGMLAPERFEPTPKRYIEACADGILLGDRYLPITKVVGAVLAAVWNEGLLQHGGERPDEIRLTHPAAWQEDRRRLLREAAAEAGMDEVTLVKEPEAAAICLARQDNGASLGQGALTMVLDLGGGTFDVTVLRRTGNRFKVLGTEGDNELGGCYFDDHLYEDLGSTGLDPADWERLRESDDIEWSRANHEFRRRVREAKEAVSKVPVHPFLVPAPVSRELQLTRERLERVIRDDVERAMEIATTALTRAGVGAAQLSAVYLVGGSSRIPLVLEVVRDRFGQAHFRGDPKAVVAQGAVAFESTLVTEPAAAAKPQPTKARPWWVVPAAVSGAALLVALIFVLTVGGTKTLSGRIVDSRGEPMTDLEVSITAELMGEPKTWETKTDGDGEWEVRGDAEKLTVLGVYAYAQIPYRDGVWSRELVPLFDDADPDWHELDFAVAIAGEDDPAIGSYYGGTVTVLPSLTPDGSLDLASIAGPGAVITLNFEPAGKMLDGTDGEPRSYEFSVDELSRVDDVPLGVYQLTASITATDGSTIALVFEGEDGLLYPAAEVDFFDDPQLPGSATVTVLPDPSVGVMW